MTVLEIIQLCVIAVAVLALSIYIIVMGIKNKWLSKLIEAAKEAIVEAEKQWPEGHGEEKKQYVLNKISDKCKELGIPYEILKKLIDKLVEEIVGNYNTIAKSK